MMTTDDILALLTPRDASIAAHRVLCVGPPDAKHMSGGACFATLLAAPEAEHQRPVIQASAQFIAAPAEGTSATVTTHTLMSGRSIAQARAALQVDGADRVQVQASLGRRPDVGTHEWTRMPDVPDPEHCGPIPFVREDAGDLHTHLDMRLATDFEHDGARGQMAFWIRAPARGIDSAFLALAADYLPESIHFNIGRPAGATSLDNTLRIIARPATEWVLCVTQLDAIEAGLFHGRMALHARDGALIATAAQSGVVRLIEPDATRA
ncbi:TesB-like acyl-CoA thioesterase 2 [Candidatus Phaeomarinobacter ectocarpi]|uniref:TesB-like acyl-CoA thioesterase 2 n=1 Tax=Candidatus Phaeomarinibacter ectocarpi TaxID=1458461 RepID=X5M9L3_9HYPH|nr:thioesterase family protein [Candidatus Phaeomarinobacter ectocarpi]CDO60253.1 TesB-like acyl-CoA thioesterase 2 [Candidatus Phaeomarinobacter ectocarpi]